MGKAPIAAHNTEARYDQTQNTAASQLIQRLENNGYQIATTLQPVTTFWPAEDYHQDYYTKHPAGAHCHQRETRFEK